MISAVRFAPGSPDRLLAASWDKYVHLYEIQGGDSGSAALVEKFELGVPVLDVCFGAHDDEAFTAGMDYSVKKYAILIARETYLEGF